MKKAIVVLFFGVGVITNVAAQKSFTTIKENAYTPVKNQQMTGTCWSFSTTSLVESQSLLNGVKDVDLSEMFTVRNIYIEKAKAYILRQGNTQFSEGGLGHDVIRAVSLYGAMPESAFSGKKINNNYNHSFLVETLKNYLDTLLKKRPLADNWLKGYTNILDTAMGVPPATFIYNGKQYSAQQYAKDILKFSAGDYVNITSFTHHPFYQSFVLEAPDNFSNGSFYNIPLDEMINLTRSAVNNGFTVMWDADVSNKGFRQKEGLALNVSSDIAKDIVFSKAVEQPYDQATRQTLYETLTTQDDHLMHLVGIEKDEAGKEFFKVKNSWGEVGPYKGFINVSIPYFAINTVSLVVPKAALGKDLKEKLGVK